MWKITEMVTTTLVHTFLVFIYNDTLLCKLTIPLKDKVKQVMCQTEISKVKCERRSNNL